MRLCYENLIELAELFHSKLLNNPKLQTLPFEAEKAKETIFLTLGSLLNLTESLHPSGGRGEG